MYGNTVLTATLGATPQPGATPKDWTVYARAMAQVGLPVLLVAPDSKRPLDMRTDKERDQAGPGNTGGVHLATTDAATLKKYVERALKDPGAKRAKGHPAPLGEAAHLNWAVRLGGSGYVVADADTPAEVAALKDFLGQDGSRVPGPTVLTPGSADQAHHGGGHWWFKLPEGMDLDTQLLPSVLSVEVPGHTATFSLYTGNAYVLVPPSARPEGFYQLVGSDTPLPNSLVALLQDRLVVAKERAQKREDYQKRARSGQLGDLEEQVASWSADTPWEDILEPAGWTATGMQDSCGCPTWTAPGAHSSPKSATTHVHTCTQDHVDVLNPPMHVWTDNPPEELADHIAQSGSKTISKLTTWALLAHDGSMGKALESAGISMDPTGMALGPEDLEAATLDKNTGTSKSALDTTAGMAKPGQSAMDIVDRPAPDHYVAADGSVWTPPRPTLDLDKEVLTPYGEDVWQAWRVPRPTTETLPVLEQSWPAMGPLGEFKGMPSPQFVVDGLLQDRGLLSIVGDSGVGKSAVVLDMAACIATGQDWQGHKTMQTPVLYVAGEGVSGALDRLREWQRAHNCPELDTLMYVVNEPVQFSEDTSSWARLAEYVITHGIGLVIFDTLARMSTGLDENSASDMGKGTRIFDRFRKTTGAGVLYVHHTTRGTRHGRGSTALYGALDSELLITDTMADGKPFATDKQDRYVDANGDQLPGKPLCVQVSKQKNGEHGVYEYVCLTPSHGSVLITDLEGNVETPQFAKGGSVSLGKARGESLDDTAQRVAEYVGRFTSGEKQPTMADLARGVVPDSLHRDKPRAWRAVLDLAVDRALSLQLVYRQGSTFTVEPPLDL